MKSFVYKGATDWNRVTSEEQLVRDIDVFKRTQKNQMLISERAIYGTVP